LCHYIVISRILRNSGHSCHGLCNSECRKYFPPCLQDGRTIPCKITWPCEH